MSGRMSVTQANKVACMNCRKVKTRCVVVEGRRTRETCARCDRLSLDCQYEPKRKRSSIARRASPGNSRLSDISLIHGSINREYRPVSTAITTPTTRDLDTEYSSLTQGIGPVLPRSVDVSHHLDPGDERRHGDRESDEQRTLVQHTEDTSFQRIERTSALPEQQKGISDPLVLEMISSAEASKLFRLYMTKLNPLISLLDPELSTFEHTRTGSSVLFTSILAAAAKFFAPPLHGALYSHAQSLLQRTVFSGACEIPLIQSLLIVVYWKGPKDTSAWVKVGIAVRLAYQLCLHNPRTSPLPDDDYQCRIVRDAERTWLCLSCFDRMYSELFNLPFTIRQEELGSVDAWANEPPPSKRSRVDLHVASACSSAASQIAWAKYRHTHQGLSQEFRWTFLQGILEDYVRHLSHWCPENIEARLFPDAEHRFLRWFDLCHLLRLKHELSQCARDKTTAVTLVTECLALSDDFVSQTKFLAEDHTLLYLQDTSAAFLSAFARVMFKIFWVVTADQKRLVLYQLKQVYTCCNDLAGADPEAVTAFIARYLRRLLRTISAESRQSTPAPPVDPIQPSDGTQTPIFNPAESRETPHIDPGPTTQLDGISNSGQIQIGASDQAVTNELEQFLSLAAVEEPIMYGTMDRDYWSSILGVGELPQLWTS